MKTSIKSQIIAHLIKGGNNAKDAEQMTNEHFDYVQSVYPLSSVKSKAEIIRTIY